jgi:hypothetical protein
MAQFSSRRADSYLLDCMFCPLYNFRYLISYAQLLSISSILSYFNSFTDFNMCHVYLSNILNSFPCIYLWGAWGGVVVKALRYSRTVPASILGGVTGFLPTVP